MDVIKEFEHFSDAEVIRHIVSGESRLYELLVRRNNLFLYKTGRAYGYNHEDTQDLMQDVYVNAYLNLSKFENRSSFKTWIIKIMLNNCFQRQQKFSFKNELSGTKSIHENSNPMYSSNQHTDTDKAIINRELNHVIEYSLGQIPNDYRMVFSLREISGLNIDETADVLNISKANVKVRHYRAKAMLRKEIEKKYSAEDIFEFNLIYCNQIVNRVMNKIKQI